MWVVRASRNHLYGGDNTIGVKDAGEASCGVAVVFFDRNYK